MEDFVSDPRFSSDESLSSDKRSQPPRRPRPGRTWPKLMLVLRRVHLYAGLFLLPWVFLYGVTGAMFNHQGLFPDVTIQALEASVLTDSAMAEFPAPAAFAEQVVRALRESAGDVTIKLANEPGAEFTNPVSFELFESGNRYVVEINPVTHASKVVGYPKNDETLEPLLKDVHNIKLDPDPHEAARRSVKQILDEVGLVSTSDPMPFAWTKLNFLANIDGEPARVTYVLKDGHVDVTRYEGEDGMSPRQFFLRLHTAHGRSPHWNGRSLWSLMIDVMAIAMVTWGLTGLLMWWQIKRTRLIGGAVMLLSIATASLLYLSLLDFYAMTKM
jgi:hypothetical protein